MKKKIPNINDFHSMKKLDKQIKYLGKLEPFVLFDKDTSRKIVKSYYKLLQIRKRKLKGVV